MGQRIFAVLAALVLALGLAAGVAWWWLQQEPPAPPPAVASAPEPVAAPATPPAPPAPAILHPIEAADAAASAPEQARPLPPADKADAYIAEALTELLGKKSVLTFLSTDGFVARLVATVDNLDRPQAASRLWPVNPMPGRFATAPVADGTLIGADNARRYAAFVQFATSLNAAKTVALYKRLYPLFQQAYEELGYPGKYFNDRVVQVIDHLVQTPEVVGPIKVRLTDVKGPIASTTPWLRYEFEDATLEERSAGQKILLRMGADNARQLKRKLGELRALIARG